MRKRTVMQGAALLAALCVSMVGTATADASTPSLKSLAKAVKKLQHDNKVLSKRIKAQTGALNGLVGCMQYVNLTQYGDGSAGVFGYSYDAADGVGPFLTTAVDATGTSDSGTPFLIIAPECSPTARVAARSLGRAFGPSIFPQATIATAAHR
jgi:hypothetical protein